MITPKDRLVDGVNEKRTMPFDWIWTILVEKSVYSIGVLQEILPLQYLHRTGVW